MTSGMLPDLGCSKLSAWDLSDPLTEAVFGDNGYLTEPTDKDPLTPVQQFQMHDLNAYRQEPGGTKSSMLKQSAARRLALVEQDLPAGYGLAVFDGWHSEELQSGLVGKGGVMSECSRLHGTGEAASVTLAWNGHPLALGTAFASDSPKVNTLAFEQAGVSPDVRDLRRLLVRAMTARGWMPQRHAWFDFVLAEQPSSFS